ncbi:unnamed protein product [Sympodiomycopsis kandeliae]
MSPPPSAYPTEDFPSPLIDTLSTPIPPSGRENTFAFSTRGMAMPSIVSERKAKRRAQNRESQKAFRKRKAEQETELNRKFCDLSSQLEKVQDENEHLRQMLYRANSRKRMRGNLRVDTETQHDTRVVVSPSPSPSTSDSNCTASPETPFLLPVPSFNQKFQPVELSTIESLTSNCSFNGEPSIGNALRQPTPIGTGLSDLESSYQHGHTMPPIFVHANPHVDDVKVDADAENQTVLDLLSISPSDEHPHMQITPRTTSDHGGHRQGPPTTFNLDFLALSE